MVPHTQQLTTQQETTVVTPQAVLGDDDCGFEAERISVLVAQVGPIKQPKQAISFLDKVSPSVGGQQVKGNCTFCSKLISSTGATRIVDHLAWECPLVPPEVKAGVHRASGWHTGKAC